MSLHIHIHLEALTEMRGSHPYAEHQPATSQWCCVCARKKAFRNKFPTCGSCYRKATGIDSLQALNPPADVARDLQDGEEAPAPADPHPEPVPAHADPEPEPNPAAPLP